MICYNIPNNNEKNNFLNFCRTHEGDPGKDGVNKKSKKALKINTRTGKIKVRKKTAKGTYRMKVTVTAAGSAKYEAARKTVTVIIKVTK